MEIKLSDEAIERGLPLFCGPFFLLAEAEENSVFRVAREFEAPEAERDFSSAWIHSCLDRIRCAGHDDADAIHGVLCGSEQRIHFAARNEPALEISHIGDVYFQHARVRVRVFENFCAR